MCLLQVYHNINNPLNETFLKFLEKKYQTINHNMKFTAHLK